LEIHNNCDQSFIDEMIHHEILQSFDDGDGDDDVFVRSCRVSCRNLLELCCSWDHFIFAAASYRITDYVPKKDDEGDSGGQRLRAVLRHNTEPTLLVIPIAIVMQEIEIGWLQKSTPFRTNSDSIEHTQRKKKKLKSGSAQEALERSFRASFEEPARANL
jgi:hypothetical protein